MQLDSRSNPASPKIVTVAEDQKANRSDYSYMLLDIAAFASLAWAKLASLLRRFLAK